MTTYKRSTWSLLFSLYATQYVGISFLLVALVAILRSQGMPLEKLSIVYSLGIFWVFKFLWAPLIDRFSLRRFGHYRIWLLTLQAAMIINLFILGLYDLSTARCKQPWSGKWHTASWHHVWELSWQWFGIVYLPNARMAWLYVAYGRTDRYLLASANFL